MVYHDENELENNPNAAQVVRDLMREFMHPKIVEDVIAPDWTAIYGTPGGQDIKILDLQRFADGPRRKAGGLEFDEPEAFVQYVNKHKGAGTLVLSDAEKLSVSAVLDHHAADAPGWAEHEAKLELTFTPEWAAWLRISNREIAQTDFAEFLEDHYVDVAEPAGAELLDLALEFRATLSASYSKAVRLQSGQTQLTYTEDVSAGGGAGRIVVPEEITLALAPFEGVTKWRIPARFRFRLRDGKVHFVVKLGDEANRVFRQAWRELLADLSEKIGEPILAGTRRQ